jgi:prepilin-type N-terminal cleavage/methylation domain-containing protein
VTRNSAKGFSLLELVMVLGVMGVLLAVAVPRMGSFGSSDDSHNLSNALSLAKLKAASAFTQTRLFVDLGGRRHHIEWWRKTGTPGWVALNGPTLLNNGEAFAFAPVGTPPPSTQPAIAQAPLCRDDDGMDIAGTACVVFNSRGVPVDTTGAPTNGDALYVTNGNLVGAVTVSATGLISVWSTRSQATPAWAHK